MDFKQINFSKYSSFKIGGIHEVALIENDLSDLENFYLIGACNNTLVGNNPPPLAMLSKKYDYIHKEDKVLKIGAATPSGKIASFCKKHNITGFEFLSHLPGKLGGLIKMNAGLKEYEIFNNLLAIETPLGTRTKESLKYGYRFTNINEVILEASFIAEDGFDQSKVAMFQKMRANQPSAPSAGSCFKNPEGDYAGRLIEAVGLKGVMQGALCFSKEHANFLINTGEGTFNDALTLIQKAQHKVYKEFDIWLECEVLVLDKRFMGKSSPLLKPL